MCFIPLTNTVLDVYEMNPLKIRNLLAHEFDFHGFSRYGGGAFHGIMPLNLSFKNHDASLFHLIK